MAEKKSKCNIPSFPIPTFGIPIPTLTLPTLPTFELKFTIPCPLD